MAQKWILRKGTKESGFRYVAPNGRPVKDRDKLSRIDVLRIPPAWREVHIASSPRSPIQAWGLDARGRKQYRYHPRTVEIGELSKHYRVRLLGQDLPRLKQKLHKHLRLRGFPREKVCAGIVLLISDAFFRVGSDRYEQENNTFGITTLKRSHVTVAGGAVRFEYRGKRGIKQWQYIHLAEMVTFIKALLKTPGRRLFRYEEDGKWLDVAARDVNEYLKELAQFPYTAKDFRTWGGTLRMATVLADLDKPRNERERRKTVASAIRFVAADLGNTPAICRKSYVHPVLISRYLKNGSTIDVRHDSRSVRSASPFRHSAEEEALIDFLAQYFPERRRKRRTD
jgi:DNA topoisomerase I